MKPLLVIPLALAIAIALLLWPTDWSNEPVVGDENLGGASHDADAEELTLPQFASPARRAPEHPSSEPTEGDIVSPLTSVGVQVRLLATIGDGETEAVEGVGLRFRTRPEVGPIGAWRSCGESATDGCVGVVLPIGVPIQFEVEEEDLPDGVVPFRHIEWEGVDLSAAAGSLRQFDGSSEGSIVDLFLRPSRSVSGVVLGPDGVAISGVQLTCSYAVPARFNTAKFATTDAEGEFELSGLDPALYWLQLYVLEADSGGSSAPRAIFLDLREGDQESLVVRVGQGPAAISGRVVDEDGEPQRDLSVLIFYANRDPSGALPASIPAPSSWSHYAVATSTDDDGVYLAEGLEATSYFVQVGINEAEPGGPDKRRLRAYPKRMEVTAAAIASGWVEMPDLVVERSRPFVVRGRVTSESRGLDLRKIQVSASFVENDGSGALDRRPGNQLSPFVDWDRKTGEYVVSCDTPAPPIQVKASARGWETASAIFVPVPDSDSTRHDFEIRGRSKSK